MSKKIKKNSIKKFKKNIKCEIPIEQNRINEIIKILSLIAKGDFSHYCEIKNLETPDSLDALSLGVNIMISDLGAQTKRIQEIIDETNKKNEQIEKLNKIFIGREVKMVELKEEIKKLNQELAELKGKK